MAFFIFVNKRKPPRMKKIGILFIMQLGLFVSYSQINYVDQSSSVLINQNTGFAFEGSGVSFVDYNGDGFDDITLATGEDEPVIFYKNVDGSFFTQEFLIPSQDYSYRMRSVLWVDYDNDGDKDLFLASDLNGNRLFNNNNGTLTDVTIASGLPTDNLFTYGVSFGDYNNDGCLDLYMSNRVVTLPITNYLFENNCDGTFTDVTQSAGVGTTANATYSSTFFDFNNDGWQDIYEANDKSDPNILYKNNGDGTFTDVSLSSNTGIVIDAMCVTIDDYDSDGYLDIFITNRANPNADALGTVLFKNNGNETFTNVTDTENVSLVSFTWGSNFIDAENDGDLDLYVNSQFTSSEGPSYGFYENNNGSFTSSLTSGFTTNNYRSYSSAIGDYNNDGVMDIISNNSENQLPSLWENNAVVNNNYLAISLEGVTSNRDGVGSKIEISVNGVKQYRYVNCGEGYLSQNSFIEIFGIGNNTTVDYVKVDWLSGITDRILNVSANQKVNVVEGSTGTFSVDENNLNRTEIYPNPVANKLTIESTEQLNEIRIFNVMGQEVRRIIPNALTMEIDMSNLILGIYFIKMYNSESSIIKKVIKK